VAIDGPEAIRAPDTLQAGFGRRGAVVGAERARRATGLAAGLTEKGWPRRRGAFAGAAMRVGVSLR